MGNYIVNTVFNVLVLCTILWCVIFSLGGSFINLDANYFYVTYWTEISRGMFIYLVFITFVLSMIHFKLNHENKRQDNGKVSFNHVITFYDLSLKDKIINITTLSVFCIVGWFIMYILWSLLLSFMYLNFPEYFNIWNWPKDSRITISFLGSCMLLVAFYFGLRDQAISNVYNERYNKVRF